MHRAGYYSRVGSGATVIKDDLGGSFGDGVNLKRRKRRKRKKEKERRLCEGRGVVRNG